MPHLAQLFVVVAGAVGVVGETAESPSSADPAQCVSGLDLDRRAFCLRKRAEHEAGMYLASLSSATIVYKGMLTALQLERFYPDLTDRRYTSGSRSPTPGSPPTRSRPGRSPTRSGSSRTTARSTRSAATGTGCGPARRCWRPASSPTPRAAGSSGSAGARRDASDSASFDACLELLHMGGRSLPHAVLMMIPQAWENDTGMDPARKAFYRFHASLMEPWDGPA